MATWVVAGLAAGWPAGRVTLASLKTNKHHIPSRRWGKVISLEVASRAL